MKTRLLLALAAAVTAASEGRPPTAHASCNLVPSAEQSFPSVLGSASAPFARPLDTVTVRREASVFSQDPAGNEVALRFEPPGGPVTVLTGIEALSPADGSACSPLQCTNGLCRCLSFVFPNTDSAVGSPDDGHTLVGPVKIEVRTAGEITAVIERLFVPGSQSVDPFFPSFVALPAPTIFTGLVGEAGGEVLAASDATENLFIPFDFAALLGPDVKRTRFLEANVPGLAVEDPIVIDVFTKDGRRLPPFARQIAEDDILGTADADQSVLRIAGGAVRTGLTPEEGRGPIVIPNVVGFADPQKRADPITLAVGERFAVYENRECGRLDAESECLDLNGDGDEADFFLFALDVTQPHAQPIVVDELDGRGFAGYPNGFPPFALYAFAASDELVAFRIPEPLSVDPTFTVDVNGNGHSGDVIRSGAFDLTRAAPISLAADSPRQEIADGLLAFSFDVNPPAGPDVLLFYDALRQDPGPFLVSDATTPFFPVTRFPFTGIFPFGSIPADFAVSDGRVGFVTIEPLLGKDFTGDKKDDDFAVLLADTRTGTVTNLREATDVPILKLSPRWLVFDALRQNRSPVGLFDVTKPHKRPRLICDDPSTAGSVVPSLSDTLIPCAKFEDGRDLNGDGDGNDTVLSVFLPDAPGGPLERNLGLALFSVFDPLVRGDTLVVGVDESAQGRDLDGDGMIGTGGFLGFGPFVVHSFNGLASKLVNFRRKVALSFDPALRFIDRGLVTLSPDIVRTIIPDLDGDGHFEALFVDPATGESRLADNCPLDANSFQTDRDRDGIGDVCDPSAPGRTVFP